MTHCLKKAITTALLTIMAINLTQEQSRKNK